MASTVRPSRAGSAARRMTTSGDDLRRRWDDPTLTFAGRPSGHLRGGRLARVLLRAGRVPRRPSRCPPSGPSAACSTRAGPSGATRCARTTPATSRRRSRRALSVPFIDYARGDGLAVGPGGDVGWTSGPGRRPDRLDRRFPRAVGSRHQGPLRRRAGAGRAQVHPHRHGAPVVERSARLPRPGQAAAAGQDAGGPDPPGRGPRVGARGGADGGRGEGRGGSSAGCVDPGPLGRGRGGHRADPGRTGPRRGRGRARRRCARRTPRSRTASRRRGESWPGPRPATSATRAPTCATTIGRSPRKKSATADSSSSGPPSAPACC